MKPCHKAYCSYALIQFHLTCDCDCNTASSTRWHSRSATGNGSNCSSLSRFRQETGCRNWALVAAVELTELPWNWGWRRVSGRRSLRLPLAGRWRSSGRHPSQTLGRFRCIVASIWSMCMIHVFKIFQKNIANIWCGCYKRDLDVAMLYVLHRHIASI